MNDALIQTITLDLTNTLAKHMMTTPPAATMPPAKRARPASATAWVLLSTACWLSGCAAPPRAVDLNDNWKPVNSLSEIPAEIPLKEEAELQRFQLLPTDSTLRAMLERWAKENGGMLDWQYPSDLTLVNALGNVKDNNLQKALNTVRRSYADRKLRIQVLSNKNLMVTKTP